MTTYRYEVRDLLARRRPAWRVLASGLDQAGADEIRNRLTTIPAPAPAVEGQDYRFVVEAGA